MSDRIVGRALRNVAAAAALAVAPLAATLALTLPIVLTPDPAAALAPPDTVVATPERAPLSHVAFSPDGRRVAASALDGRVHVWDAATGEEVLELDGHRREAYAVAFSPDGTRIATAGYDGSVRIWDAGSGQLDRALAAEPWPMDVAFSPAGDEILVPEVDGEVLVHSLAGGAADTVFAPEGRAGAVSAAWSPAGDRLAMSFAGGGGGVLVRKRGGESSPAALRGHGHVVMGLAFTSDGRGLVTGSADASIRVWDLESGAAVDTLSTRMPSPFVALSPDGERVVAGGAGRTLRLWSLEALDGEGTILSRHDRTITGVAFSPCGDRVASAGLDGRVRIVRLEGVEEACP